MAEEKNNEDLPKNVDAVNSSNLILDEENSYSENSFSKVSSDLNFVDKIAYEKSQEETKDYFKDEINKGLQELKKELTENFTKTKGEADDNFNKMKDEFSETKKDFLGVLGIFTAFVTFLSIEVQLFKSNNNLLEITGVTAITASFLLSFILILHILTKETNPVSDFMKGIFGICIMTLIGGVYMINSGDKKDKLIESFNEKHKIDSLNIQELIKFDSLRKLEFNDLQIDMLKQDSILKKMQHIIK